MKKNQHQDQRVGIFVDIQNLYHSAKNIYNSRVNYKELVKSLVANRQLVNALAYVVKSDTEDETTISKTTGKSEASFFDALAKSGLNLRIKDLQIFSGGAKKADWDVGIAVDAIRISPAVDTVILASGDGDFLQLVEYLKNHGKRVEVIAFGKATSAQLKEDADEFIDMGQDTEKYLLK